MQVVSSNRGFDFIKLTLTEVHLIVRTLVQIINLSPSSFVLNQSLAILNSLILPTDFTEVKFNDLKYLASFLGIQLDQRLSNPASSKEQFRGLSPDQRHVLRCYKHAQIIREEFRNCVFPLSNFSLTRLEQIPECPSPEIETLIALNRFAESAKRKKQRIQKSKDTSLAKEILSKSDETILVRVGREVKIQQLQRALSEAHKKNREYERILKLRESDGIA